MEAEVSSELRWLLAVTIIIYLLIMYVIGWIAHRKVKDVEDFLVAGRSLPLSLAWLTILATWFGAGTLLTAADEVRVEGLQAAALDPVGAGCCLLFAGLFVAGPMWRMGLLTVADFFRKKFGPTAELISCSILIPSYFGWIAAQFVALAGILELFFAIDPAIGLLLVAVVGTGYTLMGGMWSVTLTDAVQMILVMTGLLILAITVLWELGDGSLPRAMSRIASETASSKLQLVPTGDVAAFVGWMGVFLTGALGNVPGQDLMQRIFAARSDRVASQACLVGGVMYLAFGTLPLLLALSAGLLLPGSTEQAILPALAQTFLSPALAVIFLLALLSAILSTIDSAILSPASVLAQNVMSRWTTGDVLTRNRYAVVIVASLSLLVAYRGEDAYALLEEAYLLTMVGLFVPLMLGLYSAPQSPTGAIASMIAGTAVWAFHFAAGWEVFLERVPLAGDLSIPVSLAALAASLLAYLIVEPPWKIKWHRCEAATNPEADETRDSFVSRF